VAFRTFIDTNVLVYADDLDAGRKNETAQTIVADLVASRTGVLSTQVLQEYFVVATRKLGVDPRAAKKKLELLATLEVVTVQTTTILRAIDLLRLHTLSFWDALILTTAAEGGCSALLTEDLQHGQTIEGVRIENPFRT
jgi:predicted nucleic acid-binding protein